MKLLENVYAYLPLREKNAKVRLWNKEKVKVCTCKFCFSIRDLTLDEQTDYLYNLCCKPDSRIGDLAELADHIAESNLGSTQFVIFVLYGSWGIDHEKECKNRIKQSLTHQQKTKR